MSSGGPYSPGRPPQWLIEKAYQDQAKHINMNGYQLNHLNQFIVPPDVYITGQRYSGTTGKLIKNA